jgi:GDP-D-mannose 3',5'-epimerase
MTEDAAFPALRDNEYGWEKLYVERVADTYGRNSGKAVRIAWFENCYGPLGTWRNGREKARRRPSARSPRWRATAA